MGFEVPRDWQSISYGDTLECLANKYFRGLKYQGYASSRLSIFWIFFRPPALRS